MNQPKTWLDSEIVALMLAEAWAYRDHQHRNGKPIKYEEMMECILGVMDSKGLIERTP
jgi:hypothetical protein